MIPGLLASEVAAALKEFIVTGYETETAPFKGEFRRLVEEQQEGEAFIKGPYVSVGLPFLTGSTDTHFFKGFTTEYPPYAHQEQAWKRLASDRGAANTLVATGTGSGKTECFLYPLLDHCQRSSEKGIKAIVIYPMNALATDQAKRFAEIIYSQPALKGLRVGLFVGGDGLGIKGMLPDQVITDKEILRQNPPDILLTNYKMLDYLLMRPKDQKLWAHNGPDTLRYLVVDELHTFDGAQGTDLSLLIRRLRARFEMTANQLICVGTSATLGGEDSVQGLISYATDIFSSAFYPEAVIAEQRKTDAEFLDNIGYLNLNTDLSPDDLKQSLANGLFPYLDTCYELYFCKAPDFVMNSKEGRRRLGLDLKQHGQLANLLRQLKLTKHTPTFRELVSRLASQTPTQFQRLPEQVLIALLSLLAHARDEVDRPFVQLRLQLWSRELRRIVGALREPAEDENDHASLLQDIPENTTNIKIPLLSFGDDNPPKDQALVRLPLVQCRECHSTAWLTRMEQSHVSDQVVETDLSQIYSAFFNFHAETSILLPWQRESKQSSAGHRLDHFKICRDCGQTASIDYSGECKNCQAGPDSLVRVSKAWQLKEVQRDNVKRMQHEHDCPWCAAKAALVVFGARAASLSAVAIHQLFSSRDNDDRKLLTFSDSVQDATHRAGFFAARTWQNNVRMALTQLIEAQSAPIELLKIPELFESYWLKQGSSSGRFELSRYLREFMPPDKRYRSDFEHFEQTGDVENPNDLLNLIRKRMLWQVLEDLSWRSLVGRSLNRLGIAALSWDLQPVERAASNWRESVDNTLGYRLDEQQANTAMFGVLLYLNQLGAIGLDDLSFYRHKAGIAYLLNRISYVPGLGPSSPRPKYPSVGKGEGFVQLVQSQGGQSWFERWFACIHSEALVDKKQLENVLINAFECLSESGLVKEELTEKGLRIWMLNPSQIRITNEVLAVEAQGFRSLHLAKEHSDACIGLPLLSASNPDLSYDRITQVKPSLYRSLFQQGEIHRVIAHEHTGLLAPTDRIRVENSFIKGDKPWEYNLLSATPTLEMGIDIGDLSSVLLCSVPPAQANYLQRVGRGGRRDGNSFVLTLANGRPHDLMFYADPSRMLDTPVEPPAVFLKARHVLRRQLLAYTLDCWTRWAKGDNSIPSAMQPVLDAVEKTQEDRFPYTLLNFLKHNMQEIWDGFSTHIASELSDDDLERLRQYLFGGPQHLDDHLQLYVLARLKLVVDERTQMVGNIKQLEQQLTKQRKQPQDEHTQSEIEELERELAGYRSLRIRLNKRETLNFFTDEGLLPNYAFPEEGATLHSVIFRSDKAVSGDGADREFIKREYEYQRPAQAALTELAPESTFYAGNRKVKITRVETAKGKNIQDWRFCPRCHYSAPSDEPNSGFHDKTCPRCHTSQWGDQSARTKMLKMTQVYAFTNAKDAMLDDGSDDREPVFFNKQMLIDFKPSDITITWVLDDKDKPFGFEFIKTAHFLEVNFGRREGEELLFNVAGEQLQRSGFPICRECGSVQSAKVVKGKVEATHLKSCSYAKGPKRLSGGKEDTGIENCLYLYRRFSSEALRILLPRLSTGGTDEQVNSFVAALQLGLKRRFGGKVDHLRVAYQSEPVGETDERRHFILLFDSVPGGTGYLHELLSNVKNMQEVFQLAYQVMKACECYDHSMDGCYRCLLEYRNAYGMETTSKALAIEMLKDIVEGQHQWVENDSSLSGLPINPWVDSELEARFPEALQRFSGSEAVAGQRVNVSKDVIKGKIGYRLTLGDVAYEIEPQVSFGLANSVQFASKPDFVLWPVNKRFKPVAIFLDGYRYHADKSSEDLLKRQSLMHAGLIVWSLNWYDINQVLGDKAMDVPLPLSLVSDACHHKAINGLAQVANVKNPAEHLNKTTFELLMHFLVDQDTDALALQAMLFVLRTMPAKALVDPLIKQQVMENMSGLPASFTDGLPDPAVLVGRAVRGDDSSQAKLIVDFIAGGELLKQANLKQISVLLGYDRNASDEETARYQWQCFWMTLNFCQFLPWVCAWTPEHKLSGTAAGMLWPNLDDQLESQSMSDQPDWYEELDSSIADELKAQKVRWPSAPVIGDDIINHKDEVIGMAEIVFETEKFVFLTDDQLPMKSELEADGWQVLTTITDLVAHVNSMDAGE